MALRAVAGVAVSAAVDGSGDASADTDPYTKSGPIVHFVDELHYHIHEPSPLQKLSLALTSIFAVSWVFILGTCIGSFLNVVIYRLPAGLALGKPKSRCPGCETPLAARDNIPILGWLLLRGRCRYCRMSISPRYPIIETTVGMIFLSLVLIELMSGGSNLAVRLPNAIRGNPVDQIFAFGQWDLLGLYLFHCCWLVVLLATIMIGYDGYRPPGRLLTFGLLVALVGGVVWPELRPVAAVEPRPVWLQHAYYGVRWQLPANVSGDVFTTGAGLAGVVDGVAGLVAGVLAAWITRSTAHGDSHGTAHGDPHGTAHGDSHGTARQSAVAFAMILTGAFLGWQAVGMLLLLYLPVLLLARFCTSELVRQQSLLALFLLAMAFLLTWRWLDESRWMIGHDGWSFTDTGWMADWSVTLGVLAAISIALRWRSSPTVS